MRIKDILKIYLFFAVAFGVVYIVLLQVPPTQRQLFQQQQRKELKNNYKVCKKVLSGDITEEEAAKLLIRTSYWFEEGVLRDKCYWLVYSDDPRFPGKRVRPKWNWNY